MKIFKGEYGGSLRTGDEVQGNRLRRESCSEIVHGIVEAAAIHRYRDAKISAAFAFEVLRKQ